MKRQRVYTYEVRWKAAARGASTPSGSPVVVRLVVAGAQVVPPERTMDPGKADERALFYVTPLARGWLRGERLEALVDGRKVQETPLPSRVVSQRTTWVLLALTFLVPWLWNAFIKEPGVPGTRVEQAIYSGKEQGKPALVHPLRDVVEFADEHGVDLGDGVKTVTDNVKTYLDAAGGLSNQSPVVFYIALGFLVLTLLSWFFHRDKRRKRVSSPIPLPEGEEAAPPLAARRAAVEPVG